MTTDDGLRGVGVAVTRPGTTPGRLGTLLRAAGAEVVHWPCIRFAPPADAATLAEAVRRLPEFDWLVLSSPRAAQRWLAAAGARGEAAGTRAGHPDQAGGTHAGTRGDAESAHRGHAPGLRTAAVGPATAAVLRNAGWPVMRVAGNVGAEGLVDAFEAAGDAGDARILFPCSDRAGDTLPAGLERLGATVERVVAYRTVATPPDPIAVLDAARSGAARVVTFASPSAAGAFLADADARTAEIVQRLTAAAIGPATADALAGAGWNVTMAARATLEALVEAAGRAGRPTPPAAQSAGPSGPQSS